MTRSIRYQGQWFSLPETGFVVIPGVDAEDYRGEAALVLGSTVWEKLEQKSVLGMFETLVQDQTKIKTSLAQSEWIAHLKTPFSRLQPRSQVRAVLFAISLLKPEACHIKAYGWLSSGPLEALAAGLAALVPFVLWEGSIPQGTFLSHLLSDTGLWDMTTCQEVQSLDAIPANSALIRCSIQSDSEVLSLQTGTQSFELPSNPELYGLAGKALFLVLEPEAIESSFKERKGYTRLPIESRFRSRNHWAVCIELQGQYLWITIKRRPPTPFLFLQLRPETFLLFDRHTQSRVWPALPSQLEPSEQ